MLIFQCTKGASFFFSPGNSAKEVLWQPEIRDLATADMAWWQHFNSSTEEQHSRFRSYRPRSALLLPPPQHSGELAPGTLVRCPLQLLALVAGLHELRGCTVADMHTAQEFPQGKLRDVLVEFPDEEEEEAVVVAEGLGVGGWGL